MPNRPLQLSSRKLLLKMNKILLAILLTYQPASLAQFAPINDSFGSKDTEKELSINDGFESEESEKDSLTPKNGKFYLDCQYGEGKWISLVFSPSSNLAIGQINDGQPIYYTSMYSGSSVTLTPRRAGKKLKINLQSNIIQREWYLRDAVGSAGTGECEEAAPPNDDAFAESGF